MTPNLEDKMPRSEVPKEKQPMSSPQESSPVLRMDDGPKHEDIPDQLNHISFPLCGLLLLFVIIPPEFGDLPNSARILEHQIIYDLGSRICDWRWETRVGLAVGSLIGWFVCKLCPIDDLVVSLMGDPVEQLRTAHNQLTATRVRTFFRCTMPPVFAYCSYMQHITTMTFAAAWFFIAWFVEWTPQRLVHLIKIGCYVSLPCRAILTDTMLPGVTLLPPAVFYPVLCACILPPSLAEHLAVVFFVNSVVLLHAGAIACTASVAATLPAIALMLSR